MKVGEARSPRGAAGGGNFPDTLAGRSRLWSGPTTHLPNHASPGACRLCRRVSCVATPELLADRSIGGVGALTCACDMAESFGVVDMAAGKAWRFAEKTIAVRYAAGGHAATGNVV
jgi:hypothetical protein